MKLWNRINMFVGRVATVDAREMLKREEGQTLVEYGLLLGLITLAVIASVVFLGGWVATKFGDVQNALTGH